MYSNYVACISYCVPIVLCVYIWHFKSFYCVPISLNVVPVLFLWHGMPLLMHFFLTHFLLKSYERLLCDMQSDVLYIVNWGKEQETQGLILDVATAAETIGWEVDLSVNMCLKPPTFCAQCWKCVLHYTIDRLRSGGVLCSLIQPLKCFWSPIWC